MKEWLSSWLDQLTPESGVQGYGLRFPDGQCLSRTFVDHMTPAQLEAMWVPLFETVKAFHVRRLPVGRLSCKFERYTIQLNTRPDGLILGMLLSRQVGDMKPPFLLQLTEVFQTMDLTQAA